MRASRQASDSHAFIGSDSLCYANGKQIDSGRIITLTKQRDSFPAKTANLAVREYWLQAITNLDTVFVVAGGEQDEHSIVCLLAADTPRFEKVHGEVIYRHIIQRFDGHNRDLCSGLLLNFQTVGVQLGLCGVIQYAGKVIYVVRWLKLSCLLRMDGQRCYKAHQQQNGCKCPKKGWFARVAQRMNAF